MTVAPANVFSAVLEALNFNGGPTQTHALITGSPAINAGSNTLANNAGLTLDQRGYVRIVGGTVDIGAFEFGSAPPNDPPTISDIANQTINEDGTTGALSLTVGDAETPVASLTLSGSSSNTTLVPNASPLCPPAYFRFLRGACPLAGTCLPPPSSIPTGAG